MNTSSSAKTTTAAKTTRQRFFVKAGTAVVATGFSLIVALSPFAPSAAHAQTAPKPQVAQTLYATSQWSTLNIDNPMGSSQLAFDGQAASMTGLLAQTPGQSWTFSSLQQTSLTTITGATLEVRFAQANWKDDDLYVEYSTDNWASARRVGTFSRSAPPPATLNTVSYSGLERVIRTPALANQVQVRFRVGNKYNAAEDWTLKVDQVRVVLRGY